MKSNKDESKSNVLPLQISVSTATDQGKYDYQEDRFVSTELDRKGLYLFAVFDGHGGSRCSEYCRKTVPVILNRNIAAKANVKNLRLTLLLKQSMNELCRLWDLMVLGKNGVNKVYKSESQKAAFFSTIDEEEFDRQESSAGTTAVCVLVDTVRKKVVMGNCGDSRAVVLPEGSKTFISTIDHVVPDKLKVKNFKVSVDGGRVQSDLAMRRSFGDHGRNLSGVISREVDVTSIDVKKGGRIVIGSDGLWDIYSNAEVFVNADNARQLLARKKEKVYDNITVIVVSLTKK